MKSTVVSPRARTPRQHAEKPGATEIASRMERSVLPRERGGANTPHLTPRQLEVLKLLGEGLPNKLICRRLNIATGTVKVHISGIFRELGVASRLQAVVAARRCGLLGELVDSTPGWTVGSAPAAASISAADSPAYGTLHPLAVVF